MVLRTTTQIQKIKLNLTTPNMFLKNTKVQHKFLPLLFLYLFLGAEKILPLSFLMMAAREEVDNSLYSQHQKVFPQISVSLTIKQKPAQIKTHFLVILHFFTSDFSMMKYILIFTNLSTILRPRAFQPVCYGTRATVIRTQSILRTPRARMNGQSLWVSPHQPSLLSTWPA